MTKALFMEDSYLKECEATVEKITDNKYVVLDKTVFYPNAGGQPNDTGKIIKNSEAFVVDFVKKFGENFSHEIDHPGLEVGDKVTCQINWERRYKLMRYHTAAHLLSAIIFKDTGAKITGNQLSEEKGRIDFSLETFDKEKLKSYEHQFNSMVEKKLPVKIYTMPKEEAFKIESIFRLKNVIPDTVKELRIIEIEGTDKQACGGTHVKNLSEIKGITITETVNKGKANRRAYFVLKD
ncbi:alanyl-tRNA editing protein [Candidatus Woesearchaeota archaeon]|nr:alanyl-tRNA editing protein [Candidatus Woesearchaeota archaeon]